MLLVVQLSLFRSLNLTDSDVLMYRNTYYLGASNLVVLEPTIRDGLAVLPHETGVKLVVGAPKPIQGLNNEHTPRQWQLKEFGFRGGWATRYVA